MHVSAKQRVYESLKRELLEGAIKPGERIVDTDICTRLHISRTPVREALILLERERLVRIVPRKGYFAFELSLREAVESYQLRQVLEPIAAAMAAQRITEAELDALRALADVAIDGSVDGFVRTVERNRAFHVAVAEASGNSRLARMIAEIMDDLKRIAFIEYRSDPAAASWGDEHREIIDALARHDPALAARVVRATFLRGEGMLPLRMQSGVARLLEAINIPVSGSDHH